MGPEAGRWRSATWALLLLLPAVYVAARCALVAITHDEALTLQWHVAAPVWRILWFRTDGLPDNNHLLFTLLAKAVVGLVGSSPFALRLPSLLGYLLYGAALWRILACFGTGPGRWLAFLLAVANPYVIDMMSIARGYGLSIAFGTAGLLMLIRDQEDDDGGHRWPTLAAACFALATLAHLSMLLADVVALAILAARRIEHVRHGRIGLRGAARELQGAAVIGLLMLPILLRQILLLRKRQLFDAETIGQGMVSFYHDTINGAVTGSLYVGDGESAGHPLVVALCILAAALPIAGAVLLLRRRGPSARALGVVVAMTLGIAALSVAQHELLRVAYLAGRKTTFFCPLIVLAGAGIVGGQTGRRPAPLALAGIAIGLALRFVEVANLTTTRDWPFDAPARTAASDIERLVPPDAAWPVVVLTTHAQAPALDYYLRRDGRDHDRIRIVDRPAEHLFDAGSDFGDVGLFYVVAWIFPAGDSPAGPLRVLRRYQPYGGTLPNGVSVLAAPIR